MTKTPGGNFCVVVVKGEVKIGERACCVIGSFETRETARDFLISKGFNTQYRCFIEKYPFNTWVINPGPGEIIVYIAHLDNPIDAAFPRSHT